jgi:hypothetical protein
LLNLLPLSISISTSLSRPISPGGGDESCGRAGGGEWSIVLWKKKKKKKKKEANNKVRSKDSTRIRETRERREFWGKKKNERSERARERERDGFNYYRDRWF